MAHRAHHQEGHMERGGKVHEDRHMDHGHKEKHAAGSKRHEHDGHHSAKGKKGHHEEHAKHGDGKHSSHGRRGGEAHESMHERMMEAGTHHSPVKHNGKVLGKGHSHGISTGKNPGAGMAKKGYVEDNKAGQHGDNFSRPKSHTVGIAHMAKPGMAVSSARHITKSIVSGGGRY